jgi:excisionase family DNA binding protein
MNLKTAAARLSIHYQTAYKLVRSGSLPAVKIGGTYEVSEAALERYRAQKEALRAGAGTLRDDAPPLYTRNRESAIAEVELVAGMTTTTARAAIETIARVAAEVVGDMCVVRVVTGGNFEAVAFHATDPRRRAVLASLVHDYGFGEAGPNDVYSQVRSRPETLVLSHVPQDRLRASMEPEHRQYLDVLGVHSLVVVPVLVDGAVEAVILLNRHSPGAPYGADDVAFAETMGAALRLALQRAAACRAGWERRRDLVEALTKTLRNGSEPMAPEHLLRDGQFAEVIFDFDDQLIANERADNLTHGDAARLLGGGKAESKTDGKAATPAELYATDLEYQDEERVMRRDGGELSLMVHRALVRDDTARPRAVVVVAQPLPRP